MIIDGCKINVLYSTNDQGKPREHQVQESGKLSYSSNLRSRKGKSEIWKRRAATIGLL